MRTIKEIKADLKALRAEMKAAGVRKTSCFNGGLDRETYRLNAQRFALETELQRAESAVVPPALVSYETVAGEMPVSLSFQIKVF